MKQLSKQAFQSAADRILTQARPLEKAKLNRLLQGGHEKEIIQALSFYQNEDGGFGHGLEADVRLPDSSPLATSVALQTLVDIDYDSEARSMIRQAISYFQATFDEQRQGWFAVPPEVNDHPHAFWWDVHDDGMSWIDHHWGNPSAEIIGYLLKYKEDAPLLNADQLTTQSIQHFSGLGSYESEHELYCYLRFFKLHPHLLTVDLHRRIEQAVQETVVTDQNKWSEYVPFPLKFKDDPDSLKVGITQESLNDNLNYFIESIANHYYIHPTWQWTDYMEVWDKAKVEWQGLLTLEVLTWLFNFKRIQS